MSNNIDISGSGKVTGGDYNNINISGRGKVIGDVKANNINVSGMAKALGDMEFREMVISGSFKALGNLNATENIGVSGRFKGEKNIVTNRLNIAGYFICLNEINFDLLEFGGYIKCINNCEGRKICGEGKLRIDGLLSADDIDIRLIGQSSINEIGGENIKIKSGKDNNFKLWIFNYKQKNQLTCNLIEGDNIEIENTRAKVVRGKNVIVGKNCTIERIEYSGEFKIDEKSLVKEKILI